MKITMQATANIKFILGIIMMMTIYGCSEPEKLRVVDGDPEPPAPSLIGLHYFTIEGIDSDNDGVRDDVERWINNYSDNTEMRKAMKVYARYAQLSLINHDNAKKSVSNLRKMFHASDCVKLLIKETKPNQNPLNNYNQFYEGANQLREITFNNYIRDHYWTVAMRHLNGMKFFLKFDTDFFALS